MKKLIFSFLLFFAVAATEGNAQGWLQKPNFTGAPRQGALSFVHGADMFIFTGADATVGYNQLWKGNPATGTWTLCAPFPGAGRTYGVVSIIGNYAYAGLGSGLTANDPFYSDWWRYDIANDSWLQLPDFPGGVRAYASSFDGNGCCYVTGGVDYQWNVYVDVWKFTPATGWQQMGNFPGTARFGATAFSVGTASYFGTGVTLFSGSLNDFWKYDRTLDQWNQIASFPGAPRANVASFVITETAYVGTGSIGGCAYFTDFYALNSLNDTWSPIDSLAAPRMASVCGSFNGKGYLVSGALSDWSCSPNVFEYDPGVTTASDEMHQQDFSLQIRVFPNPTTDSFTVTLPEEGCDVRIFDAFGREVRHVRAEVGTGELFFDDLSAGTYLIDVRGEKIQRSMLVVVQ